MVPFSHLHIGGTEIRGVQILPDCIGDRARVSKEQAWISRLVSLLTGGMEIRGICISLIV